MRGPGWSGMETKVSQGWTVVSIEEVTLQRANRLVDMYVLSPYVWMADDRYHLLVRAVPARDDEPRLKMSEIWYGVSDDGVDFTMEIAPTLFPGPDMIDLDGCEDPTVAFDGTRFRVWYTGYNEQQETGRLLLAHGPDRSRLVKTGVVIDSVPAFANPKEAAIGPVRGGGWAMFFEYSRDEASAIGRVVADGLDGPWRDKAEASLAARAGRWDDWHMSPGPIIDGDTDRPTMFYNGGSRDAEWRIGWATFDPTLAKVTARSDEPLITPGDDLADDDNDMVFAASAVVVGDEVLLYFSQADKDLRVARLKRS